MFPETSRMRVLELLDTYGVQSYEREKERVQLAMLALSSGNEEKLIEFIAIAKRDYRDILFWADNPQEAIIDTVQKANKVRQQFKKLGLDTPPEMPK